MSNAEEAEVDSSVKTYKTIYLFIYLKYKFIYFNWRLISLKYCIGFAIHQIIRIDDLRGAGPIDNLNDEKAENLGFDLNLIKRNKSSHNWNKNVRYFKVGNGNSNIYCFFVFASKYCISDSFVDHDGYSISSKGLLPTVVDIMVI